MGVMMIYGQCGQYNTRSIGYNMTMSVDLQGFMGAWIDGMGDASVNLGHSANLILHMRWLVMVDRGR